MARWCWDRGHQVGSAHQPALDLSLPAQGVGATKVPQPHSIPQNPSAPPSTRELQQPPRGLRCNTVHGGDAIPGGTSWPGTRCTMPVPGGKGF